MNDPGARNVDFEALRASYYEQVEALVEGGTDVLLVEKIFDTLNAKAALFAIDEFFEVGVGVTRSPPPPPPRPPGAPPRGFDPRPRHLMRDPGEPVTFSEIPEGRF